MLGVLPRDRRPGSPTQSVIVVDEHLPAAKLSVTYGLMASYSRISSMPASTSTLNRLTIWTIKSSTVISVTSFGVGSSTSAARRSRSKMVLSRFGAGILIAISATSTSVLRSLSEKAPSTYSILASNSWSFLTRNWRRLVYGLRIVSAFKMHRIIPPLRCWSSIAFRRCASPSANGGFMAIRS